MSLNTHGAALDARLVKPDPATLRYASNKQVSSQNLAAIVDSFWKSAMEIIGKIKPPYATETESSNASSDNLLTDPAARLEKFVDEALKAHKEACNLSTLYVARRMNVDAVGLESTANHQAMFLMKNWATITPEEAQDAADRGRFVIAALPSKDGILPGHTAVVMPQLSGRKVTTSGKVPDLFCPIVGGGAKSPLARSHHGHGANWVFGAYADEQKGFVEKKVYYVRYFQAPRQ